MRAEWMKRNPREMGWLKEMIMRKELGYMPEDPTQFEFLFALIASKNENIGRQNKNQQLQSLYNKVNR